MRSLTASAAAPPGSRDLDLVERHRYGDETAFREIYDRYATMVYNLALRLSNDPDDAADLTQEVFLRIFRHLGKFRGGSSLKTWIYRIALNHCRSRLSRRKPMQPLLEETESRLPDPRRGPEARAVSTDLGAHVAAALARLPAAYAEAVTLCDIDGLGYQEIAEVLQVRIGTVRSRIARGRDRLRGLLEQEMARELPS
jgi:RNA polymerase sigma-70 factor, ECF subfamily